ncbi:MAG: hypothetical protein Q9214_004941 [Letrouitia sp. 1 TL-2023]
MSYHRVLPPPLATYHSARPWLPRRDSLLQNQVMTDETSDSNRRTLRSDSSGQPHAAYSPTQDKASTSPTDYEEESSKFQNPSPTTTSNEDGTQLERRLPSVSNDVSNWASPGSICLCQPDPKVPRPRNAFILYRQHHQAHVVAQNPGLSNPEISKVIGEHWRSSSPEIQNHWKKLAEEEKLRHQRQYPDYRYQPRRNGRNNSLVPSSPSANFAEVDNQRCAKCGGRSMNTPSVISSAGYLVSASPATSSSPLTPYSVTRPPSTPSTGSSAQKVLQKVGSPTSSSTTFFHRTGNMKHGMVGATPLGMTSPPFKRPNEATLTMSPDAKRRRTQKPGYAPNRGPNGPPTPFPFGQRHESLPRPNFMNNQSFSMAPPPRPNPTVRTSEYSLVLPPIKPEAKLLEATQAKSVEAMVMSIPVLNKIRQLSRISPPLPNPRPGSPGYQIRGFVVAVDGPEAAAVEQVAAYLNTTLRASHRVELFQSPVDSQDGDLLGNTRSIDAYINMIVKYHALSRVVKSFITTEPSYASSNLSSPAVSPKTNVTAKPTSLEQASRTPVQPSPGSIPPPTGDVAPALANAEPQSKDNEAVPIALVPRFQLTQTDASASSIPISDSYSPTDHWQWMASLWRGIVGPDMTIVILSEDDTGAEKERAEIRSTNKTRNGKNHNVEVRLDDSRAIIVRVEQGGKVGEGGLRRVGFEAEEWIRGRADGRRGS